MTGEPDTPIPAVRSADFDPVADIEDFHRKYRQAYDGPPRDLPLDLLHFRVQFLKEELKEYDESAMSALTNENYLWDKELYDQHLNDLADALDGLVDLVYVTLGTSYLHGFNFREAWRRVHEANMKKVLANPAGDTRSHRDVKYDIVKPEGWEAPNHLDLVRV